MKKERVFSPFLLTLPTPTWQSGICIQYSGQPSSIIIPSSLSLGNFESSAPSSPKPNTHTPSTPPPPPPSPQPSTPPSNCHPVHHQRRPPRAHLAAMYSTAISLSAAATAAAASAAPGQARSGRRSSASAASAARPRLRSLRAPRERRHAAEGGGGYWEWCGRERRVRLRPRDHWGGRRRARRSSPRRREGMLRTLPELLDLLGVCVFMVDAFRRAIMVLC